MHEKISHSEERPVVEVLVSVYVVQLEVIYEKLGIQFWKVAWKPDLGLRR